MYQVDVSLYQTLFGHRSAIYSLALNEEAGWLYSGGGDRGVVEWKLDTGAFSRVLCPVSAPVLTMAFIAEFQVLALGLQDGKVQLVDANSGKVQQVLKIGQLGVFGLQYVPGGQLLCGTADGKFACFALALEDAVLNAELRLQRDVNSSGIRSMAINAAGTNMVIGYKDGQLEMYRLSDFDLMWSKLAHEHSISALAFHPDVDEVLSGGRDAHIRVHDLQTSEEVAAYVPHWFAVYGIGFRPNANHFATVSRDKSLKIWSKTEGEYKLIRSVSKDKGFDAHAHSVNTMVWSAAGDKLFTAGDDRLIKVWAITE